MKIINIIGKKSLQDILNPKHGSLNTLAWYVEPS